MSFNHGAVWWSELMTRDVAGAKAYYRDVCGWVFDETPMEDGSIYQVAVAHGKPVAGIFDMASMDDAGEVPAHWFTYFAVDDVDRALEQTRAAGGTVVRPAFDVPEVGRIGMVNDPTGAAMGLIKPFFPADALVAEDRAAEAAAAFEDDDDDDDDENFPV